MAMAACLGRLRGLSPSLTLPYDAASPAMNASRTSALQLCCSPLFASSGREEDLYGVLAGRCSTLPRIQNCTRWQNIPSGITFKSGRSSQGLSAGARTTKRTIASVSGRPQFATARDPPSAQQGTTQRKGKKGAEWSDDDDVEDADDDAEDAEDDVEDGEYAEEWDDFEDEEEEDAGSEVDEGEEDEMEDVSGLQAEGDEEEYLRIGVIMGTHGLKGELRVRSFTDFPEQRFKQPGLRWLKRGGMRKQPLQAVQLVRGRIGPGRPPSWLVRLKGLTSIEQAEQLVGCSLMVAPDDRPALEEGEFYSPDLIGMKVVMQATGEVVGSIADISTVGGGEMLRVRLATPTPTSPPGTPLTNGTSPAGAPEGRLVWVPFVDQIVPVVDLDRGLVEITPPEGLLEIGAPSEAKLLKQKKNEEIREKRRLHRKFVLARKRYTAAGQLHALAGYKEGTPEEQAALIAQLLSIDLRQLEAYLREAVPGQAGPGQDPHLLSATVEPPPAFPRTNWDAIRSWHATEGSPPASASVPQNPSVKPAVLQNPSQDLAAGQNPDQESTAEMDPEGLVPEDAKSDRGSQKGPRPVEKSVVQTRRWWKKGLELVAQGRVATVVLAGGQGTRLGSGAPPAKGMLDIGLPSGKSLFQLQAERLRRVQDLAVQAEPGSRAEIPWLVLTSDATDGPTRTFFQDHDYFGLEPSQVWFLKQPSLPCVATEPTPQGRHPLVLAEAHRVAEAPGGNGAVFEALHASGALERLKRRGVELVQVYAVDNALVKVADPVFYGYCSERQADVGIKVVTKTDPSEAVGVLCLHQMPEASGNLPAGPGPGSESGSGRSSASETGSESGLESAAGSRAQSGRGSEEDQQGAGSGTGGGGRPGEGRYYSVLEYSEMDEELRTARVGTKRGSQGGGALGEGLREGEAEVEAGKKEDGKLKFRAAHICINMFSVSFLEKLGASDKFRLPYHAARKRIPFVEKAASGEWRRVEPESPNGIKLERFIFDAFKFVSPNKVALLEVDRAEEFAPIKNASRPGGMDTPETARDLILALHRRVPESQGTAADNGEISPVRSYAGEGLEARN